jgi:hypothetical protein
MDVRLRFGLPWCEYGDRTTVVVLELDREQRCHRHVLVGIITIETER